MPRFTFHLLPMVVALAVLPAVAGTAAPSPVEFDSGDFTPFLALFALVGIVAWAFLMGLGLAVGLVLSAIAGALVFFGIVSSSVAIAFFCRSVTAGFRVLFLMLGAASGAIAGIVAAFLVTWIAGASWSTVSRVSTGAFAGVMVGVLFAAMFNFAWGKAVAWLLRRRPESGKRSFDSAMPA